MKNKDMTRKELENNRQFQITNAAIDYYRKYKDIEEADMVSTFEDGAEWADKTMLDKAIKFFQSKSKHGMIEENINVFIDGFCKVMEEE